MKNVAIVGCGSISQLHGEALDSYGKAKVTACADIKFENAKDFAEKFGGTPYQSFEDMINKEEIDVLHICTPHYLHVPMAIKALEKGINVIVEKPVATNRDELKLLTDVVKKSDKAFGTCFQNRYLPANKMAKELISSGKAGKVLGIRGIVTWKRMGAYYTESGWRGTKEKECGGVTINQSIHTLDLMFWLVGKPLSIEGKTSNHSLKNVIEVEDTAEIFIDFGNEVHGLFYASNAYCTDAPIHVEIVCENMIIQLNGDDLSIDGKIVALEKPLVQSGKVCWGVGHQMFIADFYNKLESGEKFPVGIEEASASVNVLFELYEQNKENT